jgi:phage protein D
MPAPSVQLLIGGEAIEPALLDRLRRVEVRESDQDPTVLALRLQLTQQASGEFSPLDDDLFGTGVRLSLDLAAPGGTAQRLFDGVVTHIRPHFEDIESNCYLEVLAMDDAVVLDAFERTASYPDQLDSEAVSEILGRYNLTATIEDTPERHSADHQLLVQRSTDWQFIRYLARRNGYVFYLESEAAGVVAHFKRRDVSGNPQADLTILQDQGNLKWFDVEWNLSGPVRYVGAAVDPIRKRIATAAGDPVLDALGEDGLADDIEQGLQQSGADGAVRLLRRARNTDQGLQAEGSGMTDESRFVIEARGEVDPRLYRGLLRARRPVLIKGAGRRLSGLYYVRVVRTAVDEGEVAQTFIAERNALGQTGQEEFGQVAEEVPAQ